jgi:hypothetical protein
MAEVKAAGAYAIGFIWSEWNAIQRSMTVRCSTCREASDRNGQRTCLRCHRDYVRAYRPGWGDKKVLAEINKIKKLLRQQQI